MAAVKWTKSQQEAIAARNGTVLVSAAAGSGKTAVLVQRAIARLTDTSNPTPADKLLVVTFTKAAAAEMRARLEKKLYELLRADPGNETLRRQSILLGQAGIGTIHSFCADLIREFFHLLDVPADFKIVTDKQEEELKTECASEVLSEAFADRGYEALADAFIGERDDRQLAAVIMNLYAYMQSHPFPVQWLEEKIGMYFNASDVGISPWGEVVLAYTESAALYCQGAAKQAIALVRGDEVLEKAFLPVLSDELAGFEAMAAAAKKRRWDETAGLVRNFRFGRRGPARGYEGDPVKEKAEALRKELKETLEKKLVRLFDSDAAQCEEAFTEIGGILQKLGRLTVSFSEKYSAQKLERDFLDYNDLEHYALKLLVNEDGSPTQAATELSERYDEIMIDEYQDINDVQNTIFYAISKDRRNIFMVGDVKQSIYGFRRAMPEIFINSREAFAKYDSERDNYPSYIVLDRNFRSRKTVTESVNFVFSQLMSKEAGDIDYTEEEQLVPGADYPEKAGCETELYFLKKEPGMAAEEAEAAFIAGRIKEMLQSGFTVSENGGEREATYKDFCVLLRSANKYAHNYAVEMQKHGVPAKASVNGGFFAAHEIGVALSLLRIIDNPNQDVPILSVLMSPIYGFTPDDMVKLRGGSRSSSVYVSLLKAAETEEKYRAVLEGIEKFRAVAATMPADGFISYLYQKTGYADMVLAMPDGENRLANLHLLQKHARDFEQFGFGGISGFVRFIDRLKANNSDMRAAEAATDTEDSVRIMSIHKSKGLEFPVCIIAGCGRGSGGRKSDVLLHPGLGLGIKLRDNQKGVRYTTMPREAISIDADRGAAAEELRILYVAMTRAKEKLIMVGCMEKPDTLLARQAAQITETGISPFSVSGAKNFAAWLALCALRHPDAGSLRAAAEADEEVVCRDFYTPWHVEVTERIVQPDEPAAEISAAAEVDAGLYRELTEKLAYQYPYRVLGEIPSKVAASKIAAREHTGRSDIIMPKPAWLSGGDMTAAEKGTALHDYMQYADFASAAQDPNTELERLVAMQFLSPEQAEVIDLKKVEAFFKSALGKRVLASALVEKERRFTAEIPAGKAVPDLPEQYAGEPVILQGAIDCTFIEGGKLHIIDFKTDRVTEAEELLALYGTQIRLYKEAMNKVSGYTVGDCILYSTHTGQAVTDS